MVNVYRTLLMNCYCEFTHMLSWVTSEFTLAFTYYYSFNLDLLTLNSTTLFNVITYCLLECGLKVQKPGHF